MPEFDLIRQIQHATCVSAPGVIKGIGDDGAVLKVPDGHLLVAATDTLNAGVHFPTDTEPFDLGYKCLAVNLSDLAAMGAEPRWALLSLSLANAEPDWLGPFSAGFRSLAETHHVALVGGDTTCGPLSINVTAMGLVGAGGQLLRCGAKPGELIVVSGTLGGAACVLEQLRLGEPVGTRELLDRPNPRVALGRALVGYASACIDVSDGLLADLGHILKASGVGAIINLDSLPAATILDAVDDQTRWFHQLSGGDDYELLFTLPVRYEAMLSELSGKADVSLSVIGRIEKESGIRCFDPDGRPFQPRATGFEHFRGEK